MYVHSYMLVQFFEGTPGWSFNVFNSINITATVG